MNLAMVFFFLILVSVNWLSTPRAILVKPILIISELGQLKCFRNKFLIRIVKFKALLKRYTWLAEKYLAFRSHLCIRIVFTKLAIILSFCEKGHIDILICYAYYVTSTQTTLQIVSHLTRVKKDINLPFGTNWSYLMWFLVLLVKLAIPVITNI